ncbi:conjugative transfer system coupling protein TraD [Thiocystis violacea]|uniref:conjugative transfer system coupling protein TraD n=1 Tax=Thiocystis violacea TaxID=13725 RepID=UPI001903FB29|nr:conjugative transfer system coupling protein TraD [Thiocystis violacea]MBK1717294.1 conjugal transfer protein [Thiocystis violacea]
MAALVGWLTIGLLAASLHRLWPLHQAPFQVLAALSIPLGLRWLLPAMRHHHRQAKLAGQPLAFMDPAQLAEQCRRHRDDIWFGWGFDWNSTHAQLSLDLIRAGPERFVRAQSQLGAHWLHGLAARETPVWLPVEHSAGHILIVGTTGAGKTRLLDLLVTQAVLRGEAVVIIDPKGDQDLQHSARQACVRTGQPERFVSFHPAFPDRSHRIDPLYSFNRATEIASRIAAIMPSVSGNDPFKSFSQMALSHVIGGVLAAGERPNLVNLRRYLEGGVETLVVRVLTRYFDERIPGWEGPAARFLGKARDTPARAGGLVRFYQEQVRAEHPSTVIEGLVSLFQHDRVHFSKMVASLFPILNMLTAGSLGPLLSPDSDDPLDARPITAMASLVERAQVAYIGLDSLSDGLVGAAIGSILIADLAAVAGDRYNYGTNHRPVNVFIDEASEVVNDPLIQLLNKGRGAGLRLTIATQTFADFAARTGSEAKARQVLSNLNTLIALRVLDGETQEYVTASLPKARLKTLTRTQGTSTQQDLLSHSGNVGEQLKEEVSELFQPALLGMLPNLHYIARLAGGRIVKGRLPILGAPKPSRPPAHR